MLDERIITILKEVAYGEVQTDDMGNECLYCNGDEIYDWHNIRIDKVEHKPDCPIMLARDILREMGTPLQVYNVTYEASGRTVNLIAGGYSEEEAKAKFPEGEEHNRYSVQLTYMKDL